MRTDLLNNKFEGSGGLRGRTMIGRAGFDPRRHQPGGSLAGRSLDKCAPRSAGHSMPSRRPRFRGHLRQPRVFVRRRRNAKAHCRRACGDHRTRRPSGRERRRRAAGSASAVSESRASAASSAWAFSLRRTARCGLYYEVRRNGAWVRRLGPPGSAGRRHFVKVRARHGSRSAGAS
jgi:hypothetical protein